MATTWRQNSLPSTLRLLRDENIPPSGTPTTVSGISNGNGESAMSSARSNLAATTMMTAMTATGEDQDDELKKRLEKLSRTYDLTTMKIFMTVEALGENNVSSTYDLDRKSNWEPFLQRKEACRLDLTRHEKTREKYHKFLHSVGREEQGKQFFHSVMALLQTKGATNIFRHARLNTENELDQTFCGHLCKLFDKKLETWFETFEAVSVRLTAHVKVSNLVRVLTGQVDLLCRKRGFLYAVNVKVTGMAAPRPMDVSEMCLVKAMVIQNGLAAPSDVICALLVCHLGDDRPVLRLWEYRPTQEMDRAILEADIDNMIDSGKLSEYHEMWTDNMCPPGLGSILSRNFENKPGTVNGL